MESWLRFANIQLPARLGNALLERFGAPEAVFNAKIREMDDLPGMTESQASRLADPSFIPTERQLSFLQSHRVRLITRNDSEYPQNLREISDAPTVLFTRGEINEKDRFAVALVGSRHATPYGRSVTARLARELTQAGLTIISGGALGIDTAAHQAAVDAGGRTVAVLGCGLDFNYPKDNQRLFERIVEEDCGALVTEFPLGAAPEPWRFPMRNRIISGLSMGVVVMEAGEHSGALLTAGIAAEQGRDVMAVPGNVDRESSRGTNGLIRDGAILIESAADIMRALGILVMESPKAAPAAPRLSQNLPENQRRLLEHLTLTPKHIDALSADLKMAPVDVSVQMTMLELSGMVRRLPGNCYIRVL